MFRRVHEPASLTEPESALRWLERQVQALVESLNGRVSNALRDLLAAEEEAKQQNLRWHLARRVVANSRVAVQCSRQKHELATIERDFTIAALDHFASAPIPPPRYPLERVTTLLNGLGEQLRLDAKHAERKLGRAGSHLDKIAKNWEKEKTTECTAEMDRKASLQTVDLRLADYQLAKDALEIVLSWPSIRQDPRGCWQKHIKRRYAESVRVL
jgi:hypothetical protein